MATQHSKKSKKAAPKKAKSVKAAAPKKAVKKAPVKAKTAVKAAKPAAKAKKATPVKAKAAPAKKAAAPKKAAKKPAAPAKSKVQAKAKPAPAKATKPVVKVAASKTNAGVKGKPAPKKAQPVTGSSKSKVVAKPVAPKTSAPIKVAKPAPVSKLAPAAKTKPAVMGSKASDIAKKPTISPTPVSKEKTLPQPKVSGTPFKPAETKVKPFEKMTDKKEHKPIGTIAAEEPQKTRYSDKELEEFDQLIDQKLIVAREQLEFYLKQLEDMAENPDNKIKGLDDGLSTLESERVSSLASRQQKLIQHLENAKIRIKNKVYGICRETGKLISKERLRAVPHATLSIEAKQAQN